MQSLVGGKVLTLYHTRHTPGEPLSKFHGRETASRASWKSQANGHPGGPLGNKKKDTTFHRANLRDTGV